VNVAELVEAEQVESGVAAHSAGQFLLVGDRSLGERSGDTETAVLR
jgi:hypothetical protein